MSEIKKDKAVWGIHTQVDTLFLRDNVIAIGWVYMGNLAPIAPTRDKCQAPIYYGCFF